MASVAVVATSRLQEHSKSTLFWRIAMQVVGAVHRITTRLAPLYRADPGGM
jgi:Trk-type K+ transport system membrane component